MADLLDALRDKFKDDGLERLAAANPDYYNSHGYYVPELAALLLAERADFARRLKAAEARATKATEGLRTIEESRQGTVAHLQGIARAVLADLAAEEKK